MRAAIPRPPCRHCHQREGKHPRNLCWTCYYGAPGIRDLYPPESKFARRGIADGNGRRPMPEPTDAQPGTQEKLRVLEERARLGQNLWHPLDPRIKHTISSARFAVLSGQSPVSLRMSRNSMGKAVSDDQCNANFDASAG